MGMLSFPAMDNPLGPAGKVAAWVAVALAVAPPASLHAQKRPAAVALATASLAGQSVPVLPITVVLAQPPLPDSSLPTSRAALLRWTDSLIAQAFQDRAPEVKWVWPADLRRMARRSGGLLPEPDNMGQAVMRSWGLKIVPDPLRSNLRRLTAFASGGSLVVIPASLVIRGGTDGKVYAELSVCMADVRTGRVAWRTVAPGEGDSPASALASALATILLVEGGTE